MQYLFRSKAVLAEPAPAPAPASGNAGDLASHKHALLTDESQGIHANRSGTISRDTRCSEESDGNDRGSGTFQPLVQYEDGYREEMSGLTSETPESLQAELDLPSEQGLMVSKQEWIQECGDSYGRSLYETKMILDEISVLPNMAKTIRTKKWYQQTVDLVEWTVVQYLDAKACREANTQHIDSRWCLFGGPFCQIGKTFVGAINTVSAKRLGVPHILLTQTASTHVPDLVRKINFYLMRDEEVRNDLFQAKPFDTRGATKLMDILDTARNYTWIVAFQSPHQLETAGAMRLGLAGKNMHLDPSARPIFTVDEMDQIVRSPDREMKSEKGFDSLLGMFGRPMTIQSSRKLECLSHVGSRTKFILPPALAVVATTSTPNAFLYQFAKCEMYDWRLDKWIWPDIWDNYFGLLDYRHIPIPDGAVKLGNSYCFDEDNIILDRINNAVQVGFNQVVHIGNPRVDATGGCFEMASKISQAVDAPERIAFLVVCGHGRFLKIGREPWGNKKEKRVDGDVEYALKIARARVGDGTIIVCGTPTTTSRSLSIVTTTIRDGVSFACPPTLVINVSSIYRSCEECFQGSCRGTGGFLQSLTALGQIDNNGRPYVEAVMPPADWHGSRAYIRCTRAIRQVFEETKDIKRALDAPKELLENYVELFRQSRGTKRAVRKSQGNVPVSYSIREPRSPVARSQPSQPSQPPLAPRRRPRKPRRTPRTPRAATSEQATAPEPSRPVFREASRAHILLTTIARELKTRTDSDLPANVVLRERIITAEPRLKHVHGHNWAVHSLVHKGILEIERTRGVAGTGRWTITPIGMEILNNY